MPSAATRFSVATEDRNFPSSLRLGLVRFVCWFTDYLNPPTYFHIIETATAVLGYPRVRGWTRPRVRSVVSAGNEYSLLPRVERMRTTGQPSARRGCPQSPIYLRLNIRRISVDAPVLKAYSCSVLK